MTRTATESSEITKAGRRSRAGDIVEYWPEGSTRSGDLTLAEIFMEGPSELLAKDQLFVTVLRGPETTGDYIIDRSQVSRVFREMK